MISDVSHAIVDTISLNKENVTKFKKDVFDIRKVDVLIAILHLNFMVKYALWKDAWNQKMGSA